MKKLYNQVKRDKWREDEYSMPVIARYGTGGGNMPIVAVSVGNGQLHNMAMAETCNPLDCMHDAQAVLTKEERTEHMTESIVRRLTPKECERLQGMPDDWSRWGVDEKGKTYELPDSARYKLQGNGIATPFWKYLLKRISAQYERDATLGSLFDGQASFPMIWEQINGKGSALWSSEIDKHAIAVAKYHFPEAE